MFDKKKPMKAEEVIRKLTFIRQFHDSDYGEAIDEAIKYAEKQKGEFMNTSKEVNGHWYLWCPCCGDEIPIVADPSLIEYCPSCGKHVIFRGRKDEQ